MPTRRQFLRTVTGAPALLSLAPSVPLLWARAGARAAARPTDARVLVALQLSGGNDGLNTVVPFSDDAYARHRPTLRWKSPEVHKLNADLGLHPRMGALARLYHEGRLAILQGVGCAGLSRNHEAALRSWQTAEPDAPGVETGWLGRAADQLWPITRPAAPGVFVGGIPRPLGINAAAVVVPFIRTAAAALPEAGVWEAGGVFATGIAAAPSPDAPSASPLLRHVQSSLARARTHSARLAKMRRHVPAAQYPDCGLGADLRTIAQLIRAELGIRIYYAELGGGGIGGFDNHANQLGNHCALLEQLSESVAAFAADLGADGLLDQVVVMTFSEFGRTVAENGRRGTDHGAAGPMLAVGGRMRGGLHGAHPSLTDLEDGALRHHTDFRAVYATVLEDWLGIPGTAILGGPFPRLELLA